MAAIFAAPGRAAALEAVDTARAPVLVVHGADDRFVLPQDLATPRQPAYRGFPFQVDGGCLNP
eukprot:SAG11_NODE_3347_length_2507_cov_1.937733_2_plen_63_part_00